MELNKIIEIIKDPHWICEKQGILSVRVKYYSSKTEYYTVLDHEESDPVRIELKKQILDGVFGKIGAERLNLAIRAQTF